MTAILGRLMSLEDGLEQVNHRQGFLQIGQGVLLPAEEVSCAAWPTIEKRVAWLECAIFSHL